MTRFRGGYPIIRYVAKTDPEGAYSLLRAIATVPPNAANDNAREKVRFAGDNDYEPAGAAREQFFAERRHKITPSIGYLVSDLLRPRVLTEKRRDSGFAGNGRAIISRTDRVSFDGAMARLGDFIFNFDSGARRAGGGTMVQYGFTAKGKPLEPRTDVRDLRGGESSAKRSASPGRYLSVKSTEDFRDQVLEPHTYRSQLDETPSAKEAREKLVSLGIDGSRTFECAREAAGLQPAVRCRDGVAWKLDFIGGMKAPKPTAHNPAPDIWEQDDPADAFGDHVRGILQEIAARTNLKALGRYLGYSEHYADRGAKRELETVLDEVKRVFPPPPRKTANENIRAECALLRRVAG